MGALRPIQAYCADIRRPKSLLDAARADLHRTASDHSIRPKAREESLRCIETIELFELAENAFGLNKLPLETPPRFEAFELEGVRLSVQPHLLVRPPNGHLGVVFFRPQKAPDPKDCRLEETRRSRGDHRREMARYMLALAKLAMEEKATHLGSFEKSLSFVADIRIGEKIEFSTSDNAARVRAIKAACKQIRTLWDGIEPRSSALAKD